LADDRADSPTCNEHALNRQSADDPKGTFVSFGMEHAAYYREQAGRARRLARGINHPEVTEQLLRMARDYDELAEDLERGAVEIRHPELLPQRRSG
jgi:hypothetical protein